VIIIKQIVPPISDAVIRLAAIGDLLESGLLIAARLIS